MKTRSVSRTQVGAFDEAIKACLEFAHDKYRDTYTDAIEGKIAKQLRLAARLLRVAGRARIYRFKDGACIFSPEDYNSDLMERKLARIIHRAQTLAGKSK